jgi:ketosteroid isomerase-like protein
MANTQTGQEGAVAAAVEALRKAMVAGDRTALQQLSADELTYGHSSNRLENKAEFVEALASGKAGFSAIELADQSVTVIDNLALVRHGFVGTRKAGGDKLNLMVLTVWLKRQEQWKLVARQAAKV